MGMDVYGLAHNAGREAIDAKHKTAGTEWSEAHRNEVQALRSRPGVYFRASIWSWRPLWDYVCAVGHDLIGEETARVCTYNDGGGLDETFSKLLAARVYASFRSGDVDAYLAEQKRILDGTPDETCTLCDGTGVRADAIGLEMRMTTKANPHTGKPGWCNGCDGKGVIRPWQTHYSFTREHLLEFAEFLDHCGGFQVW